MVKVYIYVYYFGFVKKKKKKKRGAFNTCIKGLDPTHRRKNCVQ